MRRAKINELSPKVCKCGSFFIRMRFTTNGGIQYYCGDCGNSSSIIDFVRRTKGGISVQNTRAIKAWNSVN